MRVSRALVGLIALSALVALVPRAAEARRVALVVGISNYTYSPRLPNPSHDAQKMAASLKQLGFEVITSLDSDLAQFESSLDRYTRAEGADAALVYYAGHGLQLENVNYLVPKDAQLRSEACVGQETIQLQRVISAIDNRAKITLVFLDACRDNPLAETLQRSVLGATRSAAVTRGLAVMTIRNSDTLLVFAAAPGKTASDGEGDNSPFARAMLATITRAGEDIEQVMKRVSRDVQQATNGEQVPERLSRLTSDFVFAEQGMGVSGTAASPSAGAGSAGRVAPGSASAVRPAAPGGTSAGQSGTASTQSATSSGQAGNTGDPGPKDCHPFGGNNRQTLMVRVGSVVCSAERAGPRHHRQAGSGGGGLFSQGCRDGVQVERPVSVQVGARAVLPGADLRGALCRQGPGGHTGPGALTRGESDMQMLKRSFASALALTATFRLGGL